MMLLAINTTIVMSGVIVFLIVTLILVGMLLFAKAKPVSYTHLTLPTKA